MFCLRRHFWFVVGVCAGFGSLLVFSLAVGLVICVMVYRYCLLIVLCFVMLWFR